METIKPLTAIEQKVEKRLSLRELQVFILYGKGKSADQIANSLFISKKTVWTHKANAVEKMDFKGTHEFMFYAIKYVSRI